MILHSPDLKAIAQAQGEPFAGLAAAGLRVWFVEIQELEPFKVQPDDARKFLSAFPRLKGTCTVTR